MKVVIQRVKRASVSGKLESLAHIEIQIKYFS